MTRSVRGGGLTLSVCINIKVGEHFHAVLEVEGGRDEDDCGLASSLIDISWLEAAGTSQRTRYLLV